MGWISSELLWLIVTWVFRFLITLVSVLYLWYWLQPHKLPSNRAAFDILYPDPSNANGEVEIDIVAVHGLGANVDWSWTWKGDTKEQSVHWLNDPEMLPKDVPSSRIMVYNYDSAWHADAPKTRLQLCGEDLVKCLQTLRKDVPERPVLFIGHSLGGLVIQHGLIFAENTKEYRSLLEVTVGIIALGCPFRGTKMNIVANIIVFFMGLAGSHRGIVKDLGYNSVALQDQRKRLCQIKRTYSIPAYCFFELYSTNIGRRFGLAKFIPSTTIVPEESACIDSWDQQGLQTDHFKMNKFPRRQDRSFQLVSEQVKEMCENAGEVLKKRRTMATPKCHFMVPFGRNECFVEPGSILRRLLARIPPSANRDNCQRTAIDGLGGTGKTQVAVEAAFRVHHTQPECSIFWIAALSTTSIENAYRNIDRQLQIKGIEESNADVKTLVKLALDKESIGEWLLIVDNVDDERLFDAVLYDYLPSSCKGSILITTRMHTVAVKFDIESSLIPMPNMSQPEALDLLKKGLEKSRTQDTQSNNNLVCFLEYLPLAIKQASAFIATNSTSTKRYLELCQSRQHLTELLREPFNDGTRYPDEKEISNPVATTWVISFEHISNNKPLAAKYMRFICCLAEQDIPFTLLPDMQNQLKTDKAIGTLKDYAFINERQGSESFDIHRLVRLAMRIWLEQRGELRKCLEDTIQQLSLKFPIPKYDNRDLWTNILPHALTSLESRCEATSWLDTMRLLPNLAESLYILGQYALSEQMLQQELALHKKVLPKDHPSISAIMARLGGAFQDQGKYKRAEQMIQQALPLQKKVLSEEDPSIPATMAKLGEAFHGQGKYEEAEQMLQQALALQRKVLSREHPNIPAIMSRLGEALHGQGKYEEAEQILEQALALQKKVLPKEHPSIPAIMARLGGALQGQGKYEEAEQMLQQALALQRKVLSKEHPSIPAIMTRLGGALHSQGKYEEAEQMLQQGLALQKKVLSEEHPSISATMAKLGEAFHDQGKYEEAEQMLQQALALQRKVLSKEHPNIPAIMTRLGEALHGQGKYEEAEQMLQQALALQKKVLSEEHPSIPATMAKLGKAFQDQGKYGEAEQMLQQALALQRKVLSKEHPNIPAIMASLGEALHGQGKYEEAEQMLQQALALQKKVLSEEHPSIPAIMTRLGVVLQDQGKYGEAEQMLQQALALQKKVLSEEHPNIPAIMTRLGEALHGQGKYGEAEQMLQQALELQKKVLPEEHPGILITMCNLDAALQAQGKSKQQGRSIQRKSG